MPPAEIFNLVEIMIRIYFTFEMNIKKSQLSSKTLSSSVHLAVAFCHEVTHCGGFSLCKENHSKTVWRCGTACTLRRGTYHTNSVIFQPNLLIVLMQLSGRLCRHAAQMYKSAADLHNSVCAIPVLSKGRLDQMHKLGQIDTVLLTSDCFGAEDLS